MFPQLRFFILFLIVTSETSAQKRGLIETLMLNETVKNKNLINDTLKADRQGLNVISDYEEFPLPVYRPHNQQEEINDSINTINVDTLEPIVENNVEDSSGNGLLALDESPTSFIDNAFNSLPFPQKATTSSASLGGYDFTSLPVLMTAFAAAFLGTVIAPFLSGGVSSLLQVDEVQLPGLGKENLRMEVPRLIWES